ncbi:MAG: hypothetical protein RJB31_1137, partial [Bacteroidota bacterium]
NHISSYLIRPVYSPLEFNSCNRVNVGIPYNILQVPLHRIDVVFGIKKMLKNTRYIRIIDSCINIVVKMVIRNGTVEDFDTN